ncbi:MAG: hypothetical protein ACR2N4_07365 [Jatrophihabitans sp.]
MNENQEDLLLVALLSSSRALWDVVTPDLRGVALSTGNRLVRSRFVYTDQIDPLRQELMSDAEGELAADLPWNTMTDFSSEVRPPGRSRELTDGEVWAYLRREPGPIHRDLRSLASDPGSTTTTLLALQVLQLNIATPDLRAIAVSWSTKQVRGRLLYEETIGNTQQCILEDAAAALRNRLPADCQVNLVADLVPGSQRRALLEGESWLFMRHESSDR